MDRKEFRNLTISLIIEEKGKRNHIWNIGEHGRNIH